MIEDYFMEIHNAAVDIHIISEDTIVHVLKKIDDSLRIKQVALGLIYSPYNPKKLAEKAEDANIVSRMGYLTDIAVQFAIRRGYDTKDIQKLKILTRQLSQRKLEKPDFLEPESIGPYVSTRISKKWQIYTVLTPKELKNWMSCCIRDSYGVINIANMDAAKEKIDTAEEKPDTKYLKNTKIKTKKQSKKK